VEPRKARGTDRGWPAGYIPPAPRLLKTKQAAAYISVSAKRLRSLARAGGIPIIVLGDNTAPWLFDIRDLDRWIEASKVTL
jgi:hypothetical protein